MINKPDIISKKFKNIDFKKMFSSTSKPNVVGQVYFFIAALTASLFLVNLNIYLDNLFEFKTILFVVTLIWVLPGYYLKNSPLVIFGWLIFSVWWYACEFKSDNLFLILTLVALSNAYYYKNTLLVFAVTVFSCFWWGFLADRLTDTDDIKEISFAVGIYLLILNYYVIGKIHLLSEKYKQFGQTLSTLSIITITLISYYMSTNSGIRFFSEINDGKAVTENLLLSFLIGLLFLILGGLSIYEIHKNKAYLFECVAAVFLGMISIILTFIPSLTIYVPSSVTTRYYYTSYTNAILTSTGISIALLFNAIAFFYMLGLIFSGFKHKEIWKINIGAIAMFIFIATKYFDWFFDNLDKSLFFISAGLLLLFIGYVMEKSRRYMIDKIEDS